jgi:protein-tyrosine phosphatase
MERIRPWLYVGTRHDVRNRTLLYANGITHMLQLATAVEQEGIVSRFLPIEDAEPLPLPALREAVDFVLDGKAHGGTILIACSGGFSRSVALAVATLKEAEGVTLSAALEDIRRRHSDAQPHPAIWDSLREHYQEEDSRPCASRERRRIRKER